MAENGVVTLSNGVSQNAVITGMKCWVRVGNTAADCKKIGFVDSMQGTKTIGLQTAQVCGALQPASIDPQSYSVSLSLSGFIAIPDVYSGSYSINGVGEVSLASFNPSATDFTNGAVAVKFPYMDFYDEKEDLVIASFENAIAESYSVSIQGGTYAKSNISMRAIDMSSGNDYQAQSADNVDQTN